MKTVVLGERRKDNEDRDIERKVNGERRIKVRAVGVRTIWRMTMEVTKNKGRGNGTVNEGKVVRTRVKTIKAKGKRVRKW